jgi:hypothetical protein
MKREGEREKKREGEREKRGGRESEKGERERERKREISRIFFKGMTGVLAPFKYVVYRIVLKGLRLIKSGLVVFKIVKKIELTQNWLEGETVMV